MRPGFLAALLAGSMLALAGCGGESPTTNDPSVRSIAKPRLGAVLPMFSHPFFIAQKRGLQERAGEMGLEIDIRDGQDDDLKQIGQVEALLNTGIEALILCPRDEAAAIPAVEAANRAGVPVITLNRRVKGGKVVAYVGADDAEGGREQGKALVEALGAQGGKIIYLQGTQGSSPQISRNQGLREVLSKHPEIEVADDRFTNFSEDKAKSVMSDLVRRFTPGQIRAIVAQADELAVPAAEVARGDGWKEVLVIGFNGNTTAFAAIRAGTLYATVLQDPVVQGRRAVEIAAEHLTGEKVPAEVITPLPLVTKSNIDKHAPAY
ncbi:MAG: sugar ABC transporter substrate-binding protein [Isosphaeraceae bacterium]|nr:sugar ABC transporter substrate-binding protein [Isosphaeraceae bacterium]